MREGSEKGFLFWGEIEMELDTIVFGSENRREGAPSMYV